MGESCPFCRYESGASDRCPECGHRVPASDSDRSALRDSISWERGCWLAMCLGCIASAGVFWAYAEIMNAVMESYYPGRPLRRMIYLIQAAAFMFPCFGLSYIAWRLRQGVREHRAKQYERKNKIWSGWVFFAFVGAVGSWILPVLAVIAILNAMGS